ncbi:hypothetical protein BGZ58_010294 [Dissophora ornata]|nr:hypothetical protein BGZ58_010294 [Dissophora ornata]
MLVSASFMMLALIHVNYSSKYYSSNLPETIVADVHQQQPSPPSPGQQSLGVPPEHDNYEEEINKKIPEPITPPEPTPAPPLAPKPETKAPTPPHPTAEPSKTTTGNTDPGVVTLDDKLTTTIRYENGTQLKIFKSAFFHSADAAKKEMGSFFETLATRSWLIREPTDPEYDNDNNDKQNEDEEEEDDDRDQKNKAKVPGRYFTYFPMGGGNNQFTSLEKAAILAKDLNRTLLLPPISPNSHIKVWAGPRYSQFYDLSTFSAKSGIPVLEWHDLKQAPETVPGDFSHHWEEFSEDLPCVPNGGIGISNTSLYDKFRQQFLLKYKMTIPAEDKTMGKSTDFRYARDVLLKDTPVTGDGDMTTANGGVDPNMWRCLTCPYFMGGGSLGGRIWPEVGIHLRFNDKTEAMVDDILDVLLGPVVDGPDAAATKDLDSTRAFRPHPEFIIIHLRRGDIVTKCPPGVAEKDCIVQIEAIAEKVDEIEKNRRIAALAKHKEQNLEEKDFVLKRLPVLVATNEQRPEELQKLGELGWILLDHGDEERDAEGKVKKSTTIKLGTESRLGPWYPPMLDAVLLTRGNYLIGMQNSRMSILATQRGSAWHGHKTMLM